MITQATIEGSDITDELRWGMAQLLMIAGHETTVNALANLVHHLVHGRGSGPRWRQMQRRGRKRSQSRCDWTRRCLGCARTVVSDTWLNEAQLLEDDRVLVCFGAANRDPRKFNAPMCSTRTARGTAIRSHLAMEGIGVLGSTSLGSNWTFSLKSSCVVFPTIGMRPGSEVEMRVATVRGPRRLEIEWDVQG